MLVPDDVGRRGKPGVRHDPSVPAVIADSKDVITIHIAPTCPHRPRRTRRAYLPQMMHRCARPYVTMRSRPADDWQVAEMSALDHGGQTTIIAMMSSSSMAE